LPKSFLEIEKGVETEEDVKPGTLIGASPEEKHGGGRLQGEDSKKQGSSRKSQIRDTQKTMREEIQRRNVVGKYPGGGGTLPVRGGGKHRNSASWF